MPLTDECCRKETAAKETSLPAKKGKMNEWEFKLLAKRLGRVPEGTHCFTWNLNQGRKKNGGESLGINSLVLILLNEGEKVGEGRGGDADLRDALPPQVENWGLKGTKKTQGISFDQRQRI